MAKPAKRIPKLRKHRREKRVVARLDNKGVRDRECYFVISDPEGDYSRGARIPASQMEATLAYLGLNPGTLLQKAGTCHEVIVRRGKLELRQTQRHANKHRRPGSDIQSIDPEADAGAARKDALAPADEQGSGHRAADGAPGREGLGPAAQGTGPEA